MENLLLYTNQKKRVNVSAAYMEVQSVVYYLQVQNM